MVENYWCRLHEHVVKYLIAGMIIKSHVFISFLRNMFIEMQPIPTFEISKKRYYLI